MNNNLNLSLRIPVLRSARRTTASLTVRECGQCQITEETSDENGINYLNAAITGERRKCAIAFVGACRYAAAKMDAIWAQVCSFRVHTSFVYFRLLICPYLTHYEWYAMVFCLM